MECDILAIKKNYEFFRMFNNYKELSENAKRANLERKVDKGCNSLSPDSIFMKVPSYNICKEFIHIYSKLSTTRRGKKGTNSLDDKDYSFMNYWINDKLASSNVDVIYYIKVLYEKLKAADKDFFTVPLDENKFHNINSHDVENIKILIDLYNYMDEISDIVIQCQSKEEFASCLKCTRKFNEKYKEVIINCINGCPDFYNALELLKCKYNQNIIGYANILSNLEFNKLEELQDYNFVLKEHNTQPFKKILTIPILFPIFGLLFMLFFSNMLSPFRQFLLEEINMIRNRGIFQFGPNKLLLRSSDHENTNFDHGDYNIGYYSLRDA
ncbi:PIR Superfamily Protein [Plasmodium ovale curtisi]|uniref:PIR Superfamily Protein n=1 Tax=Plasmodium ovale curtisi TaxID=864141 RepID=A0A1A8X6C0_PLAOA|nr:PIR Superfamily Protein [Plasmodium ovale curtisi]